MKELSIEEKAKAYDKAIEIINDYYQKIKYSSLSNALTDREVLESAFPELKESEDEKIRKELIEYFRWNVQQILNNFDNKKVLTWLEKQGEQRERLINKACNVLVDCIEDFMFRRMEVWSEECKKQTLENIRKTLEE